MFWFILILVVILVLFLYFKFFKIPKFSTINFIDGAPGTGKTSFCVYYAIRVNKREKRVRKIKNFFRKIFKMNQKEFPFLYSNLHLKDTPFVKVTKDLLLRENVRCALNSTMILDECSLVADQNIYGKEYKEVTEQMRDFWKLSRHEGFKRIFVNSQSISSVNYTLKDCMGSYIYIHSRRRLPFFSVLKVREMHYSRDASAGMLNTSSGDIEKELMVLLVPNYVFRKYDSRAYSIFTDNLPVLDDEVVIHNKKDLKMKELVSFMKLNYLYKNIKKEEKENGKQEVAQKD